MELDRAQNRGVSQTNRRWFTNPARSLLWRAMLPYLEEITESLVALNRRFDGHTYRFSEVDARLDVVANQAPAFASRSTSHLNGLRKDIAATSHRLSAIEARLQTPAEAPDLSERLERLEATLAASRESVETLAREFATLEARAQALESSDPAAAAGTGDGGLQVVSGPSGRFMVRPHDLIGRVIAGGDVWEPHVRDAIERHSNPARIAIDAGAYIGLHTVHLSRFFRQVYAFEPQREIFQVLCGNLALNGCRNVRPFNNALYDHDCDMRLAVKEHQNVPLPVLDGAVDYATIANAAGLAFEISEDGTGPVQAMTVDEFRLDDVGFIKVDTQGADLRVLQGAVNTIRRCRPVIVFEYESDLAAMHGTERDSMIAFFETLDYAPQVLKTISGDRQLDYIAIPR